MCRIIIDHIDFLDMTISNLTEKITRQIVPFEGAVAIITSLPGISSTSAQVIVAETGADVTAFPTPGHLRA